MTLDDRGCYLFDLLICVLKYFFSFFVLSITREKADFEQLIPDGFHLLYIFYLIVHITVSLYKLLK